jgi:hypothetical protein
VTRKVLLFTTIIIAAIVACTKVEYTNIGTGLIPPIDGVNTKDTLLDVVTENFLGDSVFVYKSDIHVVGQINNDPVFGKTSATTYVELMPTFFKYFFPAVKDSLYLDSVVFVAKVNNFWGDTSQQIKLNVHEISPSEKLLNNLSNRDTVYDNRKQFAIANPALGTKTVDPRRLFDSVYAFKEQAKSQLRIKLNNSFGDRLLKTFDSTNAYASDTAFRNFFSGFAITTDEGTGNGLIGLNLTDTSTKIALYYRYTKNGIRDTVVSYYRMITSCQAANYIKRDYTTAAALNNSLTNSPVADSIVYLQTSPGIGTKITIPGLSGLSNRIIHRAELQIEQVPGNPATDGLFTPPLLFLNCFNDTAKQFYVPYDVETGFSGVTNYGAFGGIPVRKTDGLGNQVFSYNFNISRYVQGIVTRKEPNYRLRLLAPYDETLYYLPASTLVFPIVGSGTVNNTAIGRIAVGGGNHSSRKMKVRIIYSVL